jgi:hypothetical protein
MISVSRHWSGLSVPRSSVSGLFYAVCRRRSSVLIITNPDHGHETRTRTVSGGELGQQTAKD